MYQVGPDSTYGKLSSDTSTVRGVFTYRVNDDGLIANMRGYWNMAGMQFGQAPTDGE